jgi:hypothetical protein
MGQIGQVKTVIAFTRARRTKCFSSVRSVPRVLDPGKLPMMRGVRHSANMVLHPSAACFDRRAYWRRLARTGLYGEVTLPAVSGIGARLQDRRMS